MNYTVIDGQEAPASPPARAKRRIEGMEELVASLAPGKVARIELGEEEKPRAVTDQLFRTATRAGKLVEVRDNGGVIYAAVADGAAA